jgi:galactonate dehydratase
MPSGLDMNRREMLFSLAAPIGVSSLPSQAAAQAERSRHAIDRVEIFRLKVNQRGDWVLLRTHTSSGLTVLGDCSHGGDDLKTLALLDQYRRQLRGRSIFAIEELRQWSRPQVAEHGRPAAVALSAIEQSLWDLQGQALGVPTYELFGGKLRASIRQYANVNRMTTDRTQAGFARSVEQAVAAGFDAVKMAPFTEHELICQ